MCPTSPLLGLVAGIKVGLVDGEYIVNPTLAQCEKSLLDLTVAGTKDAVMMVEAGAKEVTEEQALGAIMFAHDYIKELCLLQEEIRAEIGNRRWRFPLFGAWARNGAVGERFCHRKAETCTAGWDKQEREQAIDTVREQPQRSIH